MAAMDSGILYIDSPEIYFLLVNGLTLSVSTVCLRHYQMQNTCLPTTIQAGYLTWGTGENENAKKKS
jgi:hypothetical protein